MFLQGSFSLTPLASKEIRVSANFALSVIDSDEDYVLCTHSNDA